MRIKKLYIIILALLATVLSSCNINRFVPEGKYLVQKNTVIINEDGQDVSTSKLSSYIALKPYKNVVQTNIPFWIQYKSEENPGSKAWKWMSKNFGKEPTYYDKEEADRSAHQMERYLNQVGHFDSKVTHSVALKNKRAKVTYNVKATPPYIISRLNFDFGDSSFTEPTK